MKKIGCDTLEEQRLDGLRHILETHVAPGTAVQLEKALAQYTTATRFFKEELQFYSMRLERLERDVKYKDKDIITSSYLRTAVLFKGAGPTRNQR